MYTCKSITAFVCLSLIIITVYVYFLPFLSIVALDLHVHSFLLSLPSSFSPSLSLPPSLPLSHLLWSRLLPKRLNGFRFPQWDLVHCRAGEMGDNECGSTLQVYYTHHVDPTMQTMMYLIVFYYRVTPGSNLHSSQCIAYDKQNRSVNQKERDKERERERDGLTVYIIILQYASSTSKEVDPSLQSWEYLIVPEGWVALTSDPNPSVGVGKYLVFYKLTSTLWNNKTE